MQGVSEQWAERARQIKLAGLSRTDSAELAAVHAGLYPTAEPVRVGCYKCLAEAFQAILRAVRTLTDSPNPSFPAPTAMNKVDRKYSFTDPKQTYRPHNSPVVFSNENLTDARVAMILKGDPAAAVHFGISEEEGQAFVGEQEAVLAALALGQQPTDETGTTITIKTGVNPLANENSEEYKAEYAKLDTLKRDELDTLFSTEVVDGQDPKTFANKGELIKALLAFRVK
ncbi:hypothetical protein [Hymenobacter metallicola]|uniref:Uncharacterized protein n=1 Tax=Hymenobacter metallicola TaxID=2563114 RepID=A0A4Z0Q153_9BACT|nr:hypothetical protein [Hymenobacter metallicola]TGE22831.1 hypothetical protein E5K02_20920 [Hymenobacter metallicola]